jgi:chromosome segregation protein
MHVIVGQGQLDAILHASAEERRGFIEEAAGVLKHRKRKEKALRKLDAMVANLTRLTDLTGEIRRQLKPLGRQAEVARKAQVVQADLRDAKARLFADDLVRESATLEAEVADETALRSRRDEVDAELTATRARLEELERQAAEAAPRLDVAQENWFRLSSLRERVRGTAGMAADRQRLLAEAEPERTPGRDPEELLAQARAVHEQEAALAEELGAARSALAETVEARHAAEQAEIAEERRLAGLLRAAADRREGLARLAGQVAARRSRLDAGAEEAERITAAIQEAEQRAERVQAQLEAMELQVAGVEAGELDLDAVHEAAQAELAAAEAEVERLLTLQAEAERDGATWTARREALELGLRRKDGTGSLLAASGQLSGVLGSVAALVQVQPGYENAVAVALGAAADAVAVETVPGAVAAVAMLKETDGGRAAVLVGGAHPEAPTDRSTWPPLPAGGRWARDLVTAPPALTAALDRLLTRVAVVADLDVAREMVQAHPQARAVSLAGDVVGPELVVGGSAGGPSLIEVQAAVEEAEARVADAARSAREAELALEAAAARRDERAERVKSALDALHDSDARLAAAAEQLGEFGAAVRAAQAEAHRERGRLQAQGGALDEQRAALEDVQNRLAAAEQAPGEDEPSTDERDRLAEQATAARAAEMEARLALRTAEERARALAGRAEQLERAAAAEREARERAVQREERRQRQAAAARAVLAGARFVLEVLEGALRTAERLRADAERQRRDQQQELAAVREAAQALVAEQTRLTDSVHRDEVARAEQRMRVDALRQRGLDELGIEPTVLVEEYGPHQLVPPSPLAPGDPEPSTPAAPRPFVRVEQEKRLRAAERALALLGTVNPLALEEYAALEERHRFLTTQLEDLKASRRDLLDIVREVDERVEQVFAEAYRDTAAAFEDVFPRLFPGGEGRLVLTDPADMLATGVDVEARPAGKKVKRLSLLSGGERSLTAVALLIAIFKARPSPFYVLDEVEAALDDTNLGRLIGILEELREASQLIVITHQKRTMEVGDALYGVTMRGDGVTTVISQRLREEQPA